MVIEQIFEQGWYYIFLLIPLQRHLERVFSWIYHHYRQQHKAVAIATPTRNQAAFKAFRPLQPSAEATNKKH